jgi:hypothetical protein
LGNGNPPNDTNPGRARDDTRHIGTLQLSYAHFEMPVKRTVKREYEPVPECFRGDAPDDPWRQIKAVRQAVLGIGSRVRPVFSCNV